MTKLLTLQIAKFAFESMATNFKFIYSKNLKIWSKTLTLRQREYLVLHFAKKNVPNFIFTTKTENF